MVLVDTSVWINHLKSKNEYLVDLLLKEEALVHPFVIGELACGSMKNRDKIISYLNDLPKSIVPEHEEVIAFLNSKKIFSRGIGWTDVNLLLSSILSKSKLWTLDQRLRAISIELRINYSPLSKS